MKDEIGFRGASMVLLLIGLVVASSFAYLDTTPNAGAGTTTQTEPAGVQRISPPAVQKISTESLKAQPTGLRMTIDWNQVQEGGPPPGDPPFDPNVRVWGDANDETRPSMAQYPSVGTVMDGAWFLVFQHFNGADWDIYMSVTPANDTPWDTSTFAATGADETNPSIAITSEGTVIVAWQDASQPTDLMFAHSPDGQTFLGYFLDIGSMWSGTMTDIQFPTVIAQRNPGTYPDGIMFQAQAYCTATVGCDGGAHTAFWIGEEFANDVMGWTLGLGGYRWNVVATPGGTNGIPDPLHPSAWWGSSDYVMVMDEEVTDNVEWDLLWIVCSEDASTPFTSWNNGARSSDGIYGAGASDGLKGMIAGTYRKSSDPSRHQIEAYATTDGWVSMNIIAPLDPATSDQRSVAVTGAGTTFHITYYSDSVMTEMVSADTGGTWTGPMKVSDNAGTAVNDAKATSVYVGEADMAIAWQDDRDGDTNIYVTIGASSQAGNDTTGPTTRNAMTIPNPYLVGFSTSLEVRATIDDSRTGSRYIDAAELVITDTTVNNPAMVDWTDAWAMNLTGVNRSKTETAWLWANDTAAGWSVGSCHRFWIHGRDSVGNWGAGGYVDVCVVNDVPPRAPQMTEADLTGTGFTDVTIHWTASPDDGGGNGNVVAYKVLKSSTMQGPFTQIASVPATGMRSYSYTDPGAGHGSYLNFFYCVVARSYMYDSPCSDLAAKFYRSMTAGKQLVSFPLLQADDDPAVVFQTFSYIYARTYVAGTPNPWWCHKPGLFINSLTQLNIAQGYWVELDGPGTMTVAGLVPQDVVIGLKSGWNMIGFPTFNQTYTLADLNTATGGLLQLVEMYDASAGPYYLQKVHRNVWASTYLTLGYAYMIRVSSDVDLAVPGY